MKTCPQCGKEITNPRQKYCDDNCKYRYNLKKKRNEKHLPLVKFRNRNFFYMTVGSTLANSGVRQGRRYGSIVMGAMSARVNVTVDEIVPVTPDNVRKHFRGIPGYTPGYLMLGDQTVIPKAEVRKELNIVPDSISFYKKDTYIITSEVKNYITPYYFRINDEEEKYIGCISICSRDNVDDIKQQRKLLAKNMLILRNNNFKYRRRGSKNLCPLEQIKFICRNGYKLNNNKVNLWEMKGGYTAFIGQVSEHNFGFMYRIYDKGLLIEVKQLLNLAGINY